MSAPDNDTRRRDAAAPAPALAFATLFTRRDLVPVVERWLATEWPDWYGPGGRGDVAADVRVYAASDRALPLGLIALRAGEPVGFGALKTEPFPTHPHLHPWAGAGYVLPAWRGKGIGGALLAALVARAAGLGIAPVYCATATSASLLRRSGWRELECATVEGRATRIFVSAA